MSGNVYFQLVKAVQDLENFVAVYQANKELVKLGDALAIKGDNLCRAYVAGHARSTLIQEMQECVQEIKNFISEYQNRNLPKEQPMKRRRAMSRTVVASPSCVLV